MIYGLVLVIHVIVAFFLVGVILLQGGRGGLGEALGGAAAQSLFGGGANTVMTRITAVGAGLFMVTCLSLAALSTAHGRSVMDQLPMSPEDLPAALPQLPAEPSSAPSSTNQAPAAPASSAPMTKAGPTPSSAPTPATAPTTETTPVAN